MHGCGRCDATPAADLPSQYQAPDHKHFGYASAPAAGRGTSGSRLTHPIHAQAEAPLQWPVGRLLTGQRCRGPTTPCAGQVAQLVLRATGRKCITTQQAKVLAYPTLPRNVYPGVPETNQLLYDWWCAPPVHGSSKSRVMHRPPSKRKKSQANTRRLHHRGLVPMRVAHSF